MADGIAGRFLDGALGVPPVIGNWKLVICQERITHLIAKDSD